MPLTPKGSEVMASMEKTYGAKEKAEQVFYASRNKGTISGVDDVIASTDGTLNWASGNYEMSPTVDPDLIGPDRILDPAATSAPGVSAVDSGEYGETMRRFHRR